MSLSHAERLSSTSTEEILNQLSISVSALYQKSTKEEFAELEKN